MTDTDQPAISRQTRIMTVQQAYLKEMVAYVDHMALWLKATHEELASDPPPWLSEEERSKWEYSLQPSDDAFYIAAATLLARADQRVPVPHVDQPLR